MLHFFSSWFYPSGLSSGWQTFGRLALRSLWKGKERRWLCITLSQFPGWSWTLMISFLRVAGSSSSLWSDRRLYLLIWKAWQSPCWANQCLQNFCTEILSCRIGCPAGVPAAVRGCQHRRAQQVQNRVLKTEWRGTASRVETLSQSSFEQSSEMREEF